jgi:hypothetical protein
MRYHYQRGATKPKKRLGRVKFGAVAIIALGFISYGTFLSALPGLGGWPFKKGDETAQRVRKTAPGSDGNRLYIPKINVAAAVADNAVELEGEFGEGKQAVLRADKLRIEFTPQATLEKSSFSRLDQLKDGDEFFVDYNGTRYAYAVTSGKEAGVQLQTTDRSVTVKAKPIGVVAWNDGAPRIEAVN